MRSFLILILTVALICVGQTSTNTTIKMVSDGIVRVAHNSFQTAVNAVESWVAENKDGLVAVSKTTARNSEMSPEERRGWITGKYQRANRNYAE